MPDIRSFFAPGRASGRTSERAAAREQAPVKADEAPKSKRSKGRKVVEDSEDEEEEEKPKPSSKAAPRQKRDLEPKGRAISAEEYFASAKGSNKSKPATPKKAAAKPPATEAAPIRSSPRGKKSTSSVAATSEKRASSSLKQHHQGQDDDAFSDEKDGSEDDVIEVKPKTRNKRKAEDYADEESEDEKSKHKRAATRGRPKSIEATTVSSKKRKSPSPDFDEEEEEDQPRKKKAAAKPRAKKAAKPEDPTIQNILDSVTTVRAPTPPPKDPDAKYDWRKAAEGGGNASVQPQTTADLPEGQDSCLSGLSFVFTGVLQTIAREEAQELVKRYGGKVTGQPSSKTSFVVLGGDAGPSKLAKIKEHGIKTIDENGLFDLIRKLPAYGGSGKGAQKAQEKKKAEDDKVKRQIAELEAEDKAKRAEEAKATRSAASSSGQPVQTPALLLTSKYAPTRMSHICGNKAQVDKIQSWLRNWPKAKKYDFQRRGADGLMGERAIIISGPPGIGKTTAAHLAAKLAGYDVLESNASDTRSKRLVESGVSDVMNNTSLLGYFAGDGKAVNSAKKKLVLIMDEVDGMSAGDRGGVGALAKFCKKTEVPLMLICNERRLPKMKPFDHAAFDIRFNRPTVDQVRSRVMTICHREGLRLPPPVVDALIEGSNKDIRQIINMIATAKLDQTSMSFDQGKAMTKAWEKHVVLKPWDICQKMLGGGLFLPTSKATLNEKIELYFNDHEFSFLMIQENYLRTKPMALNGKGYTHREAKLKALELLDRAAESISDGDLVDRMIHGSQQHWSLMPTHAVFSTVRPASFIAGQLMGSNFTSWLGNHSKTGKLGRFVREIHSHMRLRSSGDHNEIRQQYLPLLWNRLVKRLEADGTEGVGHVIDLMDSYFLTRDDFDAIKELGVDYMSEDRVSLETKTKSAFTRTYNSMSHPIPFMKASNVVAPKKLTKEAPDLEEAIEEEDGEEAEAVEAADADDDDVDLSRDKYIKQPKAKKAGKKTAKAAGDEEKPQGRGKAKKAKK
ncbi:DNA replication factor C, large subunit [Ophiocordyceps camponoti-floridani]|uniref:Replication factor C subunit 1 n=1 Tax=Ophiocordyceps camponoti-floridani TaxID=2030778 RepID=A0A8H4Q1S5_9HYPO|nr:DNA replication factor C, large subunit [Ophiocordyceps camponoti-floridani]